MDREPIDLPYSADDPDDLPTGVFIAVGMICIAALVVTAAIAVAMWTGVR